MECLRQNELRSRKNDNVSLQAVYITSIHSFYLVSFATIKKKEEEIKERKCEHAYRKLLPLLNSRSCSYGALKWNIWLIRVVCRFRVPRTLLSLILASSCFISARRSRQIGPGFAVTAWEPSIDFDPSFRNMENLDTIFLIVIHCVRRFKWVTNDVSMASNMWSSGVSGASGPF